MVDEQRASALRDTDPMVQTICNALLVFALLTTAFPTATCETTWQPYAASPSITSPKAE
jgi:hypothetical protein